MKENYLKQTPAEILKQRFSPLQKWLRENKKYTYSSWQQACATLEPQFDNHEGYRKTRAVWNGAAACVRCVEIAQELKKQG
jgi:hypothetical protein